jgi:hypothetical protein
VRIQSSTQLKEVRIAEAKVDHAARKPPLATDRNGSRVCENDVCGGLRERFRWRMSGKPGLVNRDRRLKGFQSLIAAMRGAIPRICIARLRLYASTCKLISVLTRGKVLVRKCVAPIHALSVPKGCSTVWRRIRAARGVRFSRFCIVSNTSSCSQREI